MSQPFLALIAVTAVVAQPAIPETRVEVR